MKTRVWLSGLVSVVLVFAGAMLLWVIYSHWPLIHPRDTGAPSILTLTGYENMVHSVTFSSDGTLVAAAGADDGRVMVWDAQSGSILTSFIADRKGTWVVCFSPDGRFLVTAGEEGWIKFWNVKTWAEESRLADQLGTIRCLAFSPDGKILASGDTYSFPTVNLWDVSKQEVVFTLRGHGRSIHGLDFSPDGKLLATGAGDGLLKIWDVGKGTELKSLKVQSGRGPQGIEAVLFTPDGKWVVTAGVDGLMKFWDTLEFKERRTFSVPKGSPACAAISKDGAGWLV